MRVFVMGSNRWRTSDRWPLMGARPETLYLVAVGKRGGGEVGKLTTNAPGDRGSETVIRSDPVHPVSDPFQGRFGAHDYRGLTATSVAEEKKFNPRLGGEVGVAGRARFEVENSRVLVPSCSRAVEEGMVVNTSSDRVKHSRKLAIEFLAQGTLETVQQPVNARVGGAARNVAVLLQPVHLTEQLPQKPRVLVHKEIACRDFLILEHKTALERFSVANPRRVGSYAAHAVDDADPPTRKSFQSAKNGEARRGYPPRARNAHRQTRRG